MAVTDEKTAELGADVQQHGLNGIGNERTVSVSEGISELNRILVGKGRVSCFWRTFTNFLTIENCS